MATTWTDSGSRSGKRCANRRETGCASTWPPGPRGWTPARTRIASRLGRRWRPAGRPRPGWAARRGNPRETDSVRTAGMPSAVARRCSPTPPCSNDQVSMGLCSTQQASRGTDYGAWFPAASLRYPVSVRRRWATNWLMIANNTAVDIPKNRRPLVASRGLSNRHLSGSVTSP